MMVPVDQLTPYPGNARRGRVQLVKESLETLGQYRPIVVNRTGMIILAGNHTWLAAKELAWSEIEAHIVDVDEVTARKINLMDNRSNDLSGYDDAALRALLADLEGDFASTGWGDDDLQRMIAAAGVTHVEFDVSPQLGGLQFRVIVDCVDEAHQAILLERFEREGLPCRPLVS